MNVISIDAGGKIDAGAMVVTKVLFLDYKAPVPTHFDKIVVVTAKTLDEELVVGRYGYVL